MSFKYLENIKHIWEFKESENVSKTQKKLLLSIIKRNKNTVYGSKHGFAAIKSISDFQEKVPIVSYDDLVDYVERLKKGDQNILTKDKVVFFATTSGTTKSVKLIPITKQRIVSFKKELSLWSFKFLRAFPSIIKGKLLYFAGPYNEGRTSAGIMCGSISGYLAYKSSWFVKKKLVVPVDLYNELDFDKKMRKIAKLAIKSNITQIGFAFPIEVLMFFDYVKNNKDSLISELKKEGNWFKIKKLSKKDFTPLSLWPNLVVVNCIKSQSNKPYLDALEKKLPGVVINDPGIYSSEGRLSLCLNPGSDAGIVPITINFFEFRETESGKIFLAHELEINKRYEVIMTTPEGLYRYEMNDVVEVAGFKNNIPLIRFFERTNYLNIAGELAHEKVLWDCMNDVLEETELELRDFVFMPYCSSSNEKPRYNVLIEPVNAFDKRDGKKLIKIIDKILQNNINDYKQMRNEFGRIDFPVLSVASKGSFDLFDKRRMVRGGQQKPITISKDCSFIKNFDLDFELKI